jgi:hypothetical protein
MIEGTPQPDFEAQFKVKNLSPEDFSADMKDMMEFYRKAMTQIANGVVPSPKIRQYAMRTIKDATMLLTHEI